MNNTHRERKRSTHERTNAHIHPFIRLNRETSTTTFTSYTSSSALVLNVCISFGCMRSSFNILLHTYNTRLTAHGIGVLFWQWWWCYLNDCEMSSAKRIRCCHFDPFKLFIEKTIRFPFGKRDGNRASLKRHAELTKEHYDEREVFESVYVWTHAYSVHSAVTLINKHWWLKCHTELAPNTIWWVFGDSFSSLFIYVCVVVDCFLFIFHLVDNFRVLSLENQYHTKFPRLHTLAPNFHAMLSGDNLFEEFEIDCFPHKIHIYLYNTLLYMSDGKKLCKAKCQRRAQQKQKHRRQTRILTEYVADALIKYILLV